MPGCGQQTVALAEHIQEPGTKWPFPINGALRRMEDHSYSSLGLPAGSRVLDTGCGIGHVALRFARKGLRVYGVDVVEKHVLWAEQEIQMPRQESNVEVRSMDYHHLNSLADESFDGVYTMKTFVHTTDPKKALAKFFRVVKPRGPIAPYEYDHPDVDLQDIPADLVKHMEQINGRAAMPSNAISTEGTLQRILGDQGFQDAVVKDLAEDVKTMMRCSSLWHSSLTLSSASLDPKHGS